MSWATVSDLTITDVKSASPGRVALVGDDCLALTSQYLNSFNVTLAHVYFAAVSVGTGDDVCNAAVDDCSFTGAGVP
jgi:hypothetical protein